MIRKRNADVLLEIVDLRGKVVADVGCGDGALTRVMVHNGATVTGLECAPAQMEAARAAPTEGDETYVEGVAEDMPFADESLDVVVFFNSLHHVPVCHQPTALREAARVLRPGGRVYISEPIASGSHFEMMLPIDDETDVRAHALAAIRDAERWGLVEEKEVTYVHPVRYPDFEAFRAKMTRISAHRERLFVEKDSEIRARFVRLGVAHDDGTEFDQPARATILRKATKGEHSLRGA